MEVGGVHCQIGGGWWSLRWRLVESAGRLVESTVKLVESAGRSVESSVEHIIHCHYSLFNYIMLCDQNIPFVHEAK